MEKETRTFKGTVEVRKQDGAEGFVIEGTAVVYGNRSHDLGGFREEFRAGAFGDLADADVYATLEHDSRSAIGRTPDTLELKDGAKQLDYRITPPDVQDARDGIAKIEAGIVRGSSFTFSVMPDGADFYEDEDGTLVRVVTNARLYEVAPVVNPAYPQTDATVAKRSLDAWKEERGQEALEEATAIPPQKDRMRMARMAHADQSVSVLD